MRITLLFFMLMSCLRVCGQELLTVDYTFAITNLPENETVSLVYNLGGKAYVRHEFKPSVAGVFRYQSDSVHRGVYMLYFTEKGETFQFIINEPDFSMAINYDDLLASAKVDGSNENGVFFDYLRYLNQQRTEVERIQGQVDLNEGQKAEKLGTINQEVNKKMRDIAKGNPQTLVSDFIKATFEPEIPNAPTGLTEEEVQDFNFYYYRDHYFDDFNFNNAALLYSPVFQSKIDFYKNQLTVQTPDSMMAAAKLLIGMADGNKEVKKSLIIDFLNEFAKSKTVCMDKAYVYMVDEYYASGVADWVENEQLQKIIDNANNLRNNLCGVNAYNFKLTSASYEQVELNQIEADWVILIFLKSDCSNCERELEGMDELDLPNVDYKVVTVHQKGDQGWLEQLADFKGDKWVNLIDTEGDIDWKKQYSLSTYPLVYLLDKNKVIQFKRITAEQIGQIISNQ